MLFDYFYIDLYIDGDIKFINMILIIFIFRLIICLVLLVVSLFILGRYYLDNINKNIIFECGIIYNKCSRRSFSLRFFIFIILFLIFEIEIILFVPVTILQDFNFFNIAFILSMIILLLFLGLLHE